MTAKKLNSMRLLEANDIQYELYEFDDGIHSADGVAEAVGVPPEQVYKTLVVLPDEPGRPRPFLVLLSATCQLDLKAMAKAAGFKKVRMARHDEAENLTRLKVGGISPLALMAKNWDVYFDAHIEEHEWVLLSAGQRGVNIKVDVKGLKQVLNPQIVRVGVVIDNQL
jgi:Cys-tRNA(Pro)/Cys-tRNA(Cys) deacylase